MAQSVKNWMVVYTKPRNEKKVNQRLNEAGITTFLPLQEVMRRWSDRKKKIQVPLFAGYVFVHTHEGERSKILQDPGVLNFVYWLGKPAIVSQKEIDTIRYLLHQATEHTHFEVEPLHPGDKACIEAGFFKDQMVEILTEDKYHYHVLLLALGLRLRVSKLHLKKTF